MTLGSGKGSTYGFNVFGTSAFEAGAIPLAVTSRSIDSPDATTPAWRKNFRREINPFASLKNRNEGAGSFMDLSTLLLHSMLTQLDYFRIKDVRCFHPIENAHSMDA
jgi:hypothetical protein